MTTEDLWRLLHDRLLALLRSRVRGEQTCDDLLQEVFLRVHRELDTIRRPERIESWVFQVVRNVVAEHFRQRSGRPLAAADGETLDPPAKDATGNYQARVAAWLPAMIELLPADQRAAVTMYELDNLPQQEIADRAGISLSGAKSRIQRGRRRLAELLRTCCQFQLDRRGNVIDCRPHFGRRCLVEKCACDD